MSTQYTDTTSYAKSSGPTKKGSGISLKNNRKSKQGRDQPGQGANAAQGSNLIVDVIPRRYLTVVNCLWVGSSESQQYILTPDVIADRLTLHPHP